MPWIQHPEMKAKKILENAPSGFSHDQQIAQAAQLQQQLADPSGTGNPTLHSMYSMVPRCDICGFTDGLNSSSGTYYIHSDRLVSGHFFSGNDRFCRRKPLTTQFYLLTVESPI